MTRYIRDTVILGKIETTYGADALATGAANAMQVSNVRITPLNAQFVSRDLLRNYFGISEQLMASFNKLVTFDIEAVGSGTVGTAPAWGAMVRACGFQQVEVALERVTYTPVTNGQESATLCVYDSGVLHKLLGARGAITSAAMLGNIPTLSFAFVGLDGGDSAALPSGVSFAAFQLPQVVQDAFTGDLTLGGTLSASSVPAITGGTSYPSTGLEIDMGIKAEHIPLLGQESVDITDRQAKGKIKLFATAVQEVAFYATIKAGTTQSVGLIHGTVVGRRFGMFAPAAQIITPAKDEQSGKRMMGYDLVLSPVAGNDEVQLITSF
ncbi:hypothetical protein [Polaromonas sp.]|uniref:hypothetical protein n=1 Tax=Polaromonas sp. TaxID=1869339 RepID=UPI0035619148